MPPTDGNSHRARATALRRGESRGGKGTLVVEVQQCGLGGATVVDVIPDKRQRRCHRLLGVRH